MKALSIGSRRPPLSLLDRIKPTIDIGIFGIPLFVIVSGFVLYTSCTAKDEMEPLDLPATYVLNTNATWAVITSSHLRLREKPSEKSKAITTLWNGSVIEIVARTGKKVAVEEKSDFWYQISYGGLQGWVFGAYLELFESKNRAEAASKELDK